MAEKNSVSVAGVTIEYQTLRSARRKKTIELTVDKCGSVLVRVPAYVTDEVVQDFVAKRFSWIAHRQEIIAHRPPPLRLESGEQIPYLGRDLVLKVVDVAPDTRAPAVSLEEKEEEAPSLVVVMPEDSLLGDHRERIQAAIMKWYRGEAAKYVKSCVEKWLATDIWNGTPPHVVISNARKQWGSCSLDGTLRITWRVMMLAPALIDLIVVHELAHLSIRNHSPAFYARVGRAIPDYQERRKLLKQAAIALPF